MNKLITITLCILVMITTSCAKNNSSRDDYESLESRGLDILEVEGTTDSYDVEEAMENGDVIGLNGYNGNMSELHDFISNVNNSVVDSVRIVSYTFEGDAIITDLVYDGEKINYICDNSRDKWGVPLILKGEYLKIEVKEDRRNSMKIMDIYIYGEGTELIAASIRKELWDVD